MRRRTVATGTLAAGIILLGTWGAAIAVKPAAKPAVKPHAKPAIRPAPKKPAVSTTQPKVKAGPISILYTSDGVGVVRSCNCSKFRFGGYAREATELTAIRKQSGNTVLVEGGDFVGLATSAQDNLKADVSAQCFKALGYNAVIVGEAELRFGADKLKGFAATSGVPFLAANLREKATNQPLFAKPFAIAKTRSGYRVAIIGLFDPGLIPRNVMDQPDFLAADPMDALKQILPKAKAQSDFVLVVVHTTYERGKVFAKVPGVDAVILAHRENESTVIPKTTNWVSAPFENTGSCVLMKSHTRTGWCLGRLDIDPATGPKRTVKNTLTYLNRSFDESPQIVAIYENYNKKVQDMVLRQQKKMKEQVLASLVRHGIDPAKFKRPPVFATSEACKSCHESIYETWKKSRHSTAFTSLTARHQEYDPECTICHTTGPTFRGGFSDAKTTPELTNVQCEACHGPGVGHVAKPAKGYGSTGEENCRSCHTEEYNPDFDYDQMWKPVAH